MIQKLQIKPRPEQNIVDSIYKINEIIDFIQPKEEVHRADCSIKHIPLEVASCPCGMNRIDQYTVDKILDRINNYIDTYGDINSVAVVELVESFKN